jgi:Flp pilus assembly protein TadG
MRRHRRAQEEEGYTIIIVALLLFVFLGFCALAVDVGIADSARTSAQRAADAAALAGAFTFVTSPNDPQPATAKDRAKVTAKQNKIMGTAVTDAEITITDAMVDIPNRRVSVTVTRAQTAFFARILGQTSITISATATAEASITAKGDKCTKPWFIPNTAIGDPPVSNRPICQNTAQPGGCFSSPKQILIDPSTGAITAYGTSKLGSLFTVKPQSPGCGTISPGQFLAIALGCSGADCYRDNITKCASVAVSCLQTGSTYCTENGDMVGPTKQGVCDMICYNGANNCGNGNQCVSDTFESIGHYRHPSVADGGDGLVSDTSRSLVVAPIIDVCSFCASGGFPSGGSCSLTVIGYAMIFVEGVDNGAGGVDCSGGQPGIAARLISLTSCSGAGGGGGGGGINSAETGPFAVPVRLVKTAF